MEPCDPLAAAAYALGALPAATSHAFADHLTRCPACRAEADSFLETAASLALALPPTDPPRALRARILAVSRSCAS